MAARISVLITNHNDGHIVGEALRSICEQSVSPYELVVFDDYSTDNSVEVIQSFEQKYPFLKFYRYPEKAIEWGRASFDNILKYDWDYLIGVGSDDILYPGCIERMTEAVAKFPQAGIIFGDYHFTDIQRRVLAARTSGFPGITYLHGEQMSLQLRKPDMFELGTGALIRRDAFQWIHENDCCSMGPWTDSMGYTSLAMRFGAAYVPTPVAGFCIAQGKPSYHQRICHDLDKSLFHYGNILGFLHSPNIRPYLPLEVVDALENRGTIALLPEARQAVQLPRYCWHIWDQLRTANWPAVQQFAQQMVNKFPNDAETFVMLGVLLKKSGKQTEAAEVYKKASLLCSNPLGLLQKRNLFPKIMHQFCEDCGARQ